MPWDLLDVWRDEDGWPPPQVERDAHWWQKTYEAGRSSEAVDAVLKERGVYAVPPVVYPAVRLALPLRARVQPFSYLGSSTRRRPRRPPPRPI